MNGKLNHYNVPLIVSATRSRRNISILCCLSAPVHKSLIYHIGEKKKKKNPVKSGQFFSGETQVLPEQLLKEATIHIYCISHESHLSDICTIMELKELN